MTANLEAHTINLNLIGDVLTGIGDHEPHPNRFLTTPENLQKDYPGEDTIAYAKALTDQDKNVLLEDDQPKGPLHPLREEVIKLAQRVKKSGGWRFCVDQYGLDKVAAGIIAKEVISNADEHAEVILQFINQALALIS